MFLSLLELWLLKLEILNTRPLRDERARCTNAHKGKRWGRAGCGGASRGARVTTAGHLHSYHQHQVSRPDGSGEWEEGWPRKVNVDVRNKGLQERNSFAPCPRGSSWLTTLGSCRHKELPLCCFGAELCLYTMYVNRTFFMHHFYTKQQVMQQGMRRVHTTCLRRVFFVGMHGRWQRSRNTVNYGVLPGGGIFLLAEINPPGGELAYQVFFFFFSMLYPGGCLPRGL